MSDFLLSHLPSIWTVLTGLIGGGSTVGLVKAYRTYWTQRRKNDAQEHDQDIELSEHLESRLKAVEERLDSAEENLRETKKKLTESRIREQELQAAIQALVDRVDRLIDRLEQHEKISQDERDRLTSVPYQNDSNDRKQSRGAATE